MRGRPKEEPLKIILKYKQEFVDSDGAKTIWYWNKEKHPRGPYKVTVSYPDGFEDKETKRIKQNRKLPKTQRRYLNPQTGKEVSYGRAKQLKLI